MTRRWTAENESVVHDDSAQESPFDAQAAVFAGSALRPANKHMPRRDGAGRTVMLRPPGDVLEFWFSDRVRPLWFKKDAAFDDEIRARFGANVAAANVGDLDFWVRAGDSSLALVLLLDQFPRNIHRGTPRAFASDARARTMASTAIERGFDRHVQHDRRFFFYMPFEHSEDAAGQARSVALFRRWADEQPGAGREQAQEVMRYVLRHQEVIDRFGRFPHRNTILGRESTPAELAFLAEPNSSF